MTDVIQYFLDKQDSMLEMLGEMVSIESPTTDRDRTNQMGEYLQAHLRRTGASVEVHEQRERGNHIVGRFGHTGTERPVLLLGHFDTVFPVGTLSQRPFRIEDGRAYGPGVADMKGGLTIMLGILDAINDLALPMERPITLLFNSDEEIQSRYSRALIESEAQKSAYAVVFEGSRELTSFTTTRKASGLFNLTAFGKSAHAGSALQEGVNAVEELAHAILKLQSLTNHDSGTTVSVGVVSGGERANVVPDRAELEMTVRANTSSEMERIETELRSLEPVLAGSSLLLEGGFHRPPFEKNDGNARLFEALRRTAAEFGLSAVEATSGGASDGNLTSAVGTPTIDGMGTVGKGAHGPDEHIYIDALPTRAAIATHLITTVH